MAQAMLAAAAEAPGTARELARRACVGDRVGMYTASRLVDSGQLVRVTGPRPAVLAAPTCPGLCLLPGNAAPAAVGLLERLWPLGGFAEPVMP